MTKKFNYSQLTAGQYKVSGLRLLTTNSLKTLKGLKHNVVSGILYLAPHATANAKHADGTRVNVCPSATPGCKAGCLYRSGAALIYRNVNAARVRKTKQFVSDPAAFAAEVAADIAKIQRAADKRGFTPAIRLNGTSDLRWERLPVVVDGVSYPNLMSVFPSVQFYDYTKRTDRGALPDNYALTFSRSEHNDRDAIEMLERGINVAVVFYSTLPETWNGYRVINGDLSDVRFNDPRPSVVGLKAKANARNDRSGFVVREHINGGNHDR